MSYFWGMHMRNLRIPVLMNLTEKLCDQTKEKVSLEDNRPVITQPK